MSETAEGRKRVMSFFRTNQNSNCKQINSKKIQTYLRAKALLTNHKFMDKILSKHSGKRMSLFSSLFCRGSMAVEAALAVPVFLFFLMNILFSFEMIRLQSNLTAAMHQTGNRMAFSGYAYAHFAGKEFSGEGAAASLILSEGYARGQILDQLGKNYLENTCLANKTTGLHLMKSSIMKQDDIIELVASYRIRPFIRVIGFPDFFMENRYYARAWTGYDVEHFGDWKESTDPLVYMTETGNVYHRERNCTYLNPSVEVISPAMLEHCRNESGGRYYACEKCGADGITAVLFVTSQGGKYHSKLTCPALKRTIYTVRLSETGGKGACSKCGG